jgi:diguanylate cyclase
VFHIDCGGDEFSIIINNINTIDEISKILDNLKEKLKQPIFIANTKIVLEYSLGVSVYPTDGVTKDELIVYADDAMYYVKENGKNNYYFHNEALKAKLNNKKKIEIDLKKAIENNEFDIEYQPRVDLNNLDKICLETFIFWNHPILGKLNSEYFIKQAEEMGIVTSLDEFVIDSVCKKLDDLKLQGYKNVKIAINISNQHVKRHDFVEKICEKLDNNTFEMGDIQIEFTDNIQLKHIDSYNYMIQKLKEVNVTVCISNLEIKYEVLKLFKDLKVDEIKLNTKYISKDSGFSKNILKDIVDIANDLDYITTIICIESEDELKYAINTDVSKVQGNYLFKKINNNDLVDFIDNYPAFKEGLEKVIEKLRK